MRKGVKETQGTVVYPEKPDKSKRTQGQQRANKNGILGKYYSKRNTYAPIKKVKIEDYQRAPQIKDCVIGEPYRVDDTICVWDGTRFLPIRNEIVSVSPKKTKCSCKSPLDANSDYSRMPRDETQRVIGGRYLNRKDEIVIWTGKRVNCEHNKQKYVCKICNPFGYLAHNKRVKLNAELNKYCKNKRVNLNKYLPDQKCTLGFMVNHLEAQLKPGMSLKNRSIIHIDHIKPVYAFDLSSPDEIKKCFHWTNLQPLLGPINLAKGKFFDETTFGREWINNEWVEKSDTKDENERSITFIPEPEVVQSSLPVLNENEPDRPIPFIPAPEEVAKPCMFRIENVQGNCSISYTFTPGSFTIHVQGNCSGSFNISSH